MRSTNIILRFAIFIFCWSIDEGSENVYVNTLQNVVVVQQLSIKSESVPNVEGIKKVDFADILFSTNRGFLSSKQNADHNISDICLMHLALTAEAIPEKEPWALKMIDAFGKPGAGLLDGNIKWYGSFDECSKVKAVVPKNNHTETDHVFNGQYCYLAYPLPKTAALAIPMDIIEGLCMPDTCSQMDLSEILYEVAEMASRGNSTTQAQIVCVPSSLELDTKAILAICILCILGVLLVLGTAYDIIFLQLSLHKDSTTTAIASIESRSDAVTDENAPLLRPTAVNHVEKMSTYSESSIVRKILLSFSVYSNGKKILSTKQGAGSLTCVHGIRYLSMAWVVLGHTYAFTIGTGGSVSNLFSAADDLLHRWSFQAIANALVSVDTFFTLSGLLVSYLTMKELDRKKGKLNWFMFYFHRFWRLTPPYMLVLMVDVCLFRYFGNGPIWPSQGTEINSCKDSWWKNLLYINNFFGIDEMCMAWSWYLSNDMQFFIISPLMLVPFYFSKIAGLISCSVLLLVSTISAGAISYQNNLTASVLSQNELPYMDLYYIKPYCRIGPYIIGILTGYLLHKTNCRFKINRYLNLICWLLSTFFALLILYGLYDPDNTHPLSTSVAALYNATNRTVWGVCVCWVIFACATGNGGFVNRILSWSPFVPLGRLTYCTYLIHIFVIYMYGNTIRTAFYATDTSMIYLFLGSLVLSNMAAFVTSLIFEAPMMGLEKVAFQR